MDKKARILEKIVVEREHRLDEAKNRFKKYQRNCEHKFELIDNTEHKLAGHFRMRRYDLICKKCGYDAENLYKTGR